MGPLPVLYDGGRFAAARRPLPQLLELLDAVGERASVMLDLKGPGRVDEHVAAVLDLRPTGPPVLVCSRWWPGLAALAGSRWARPVLSARTDAELHRLLGRLEHQTAPYGVSLHRSLCTPAVVTHLRSQVELMMTWAVNTSACLDAVLACGVNGIISDEPTVLRDVLDP